MILELAGTITRLLADGRAGNSSATAAVFDRLYNELRGLARTLLRSSGIRESDLQATALVHAAVERVLERGELTAENRRHFFFLLGRAMHHVLVERTRANSALKREGRRRRIAMPEVLDPSSGENTDRLDLAAALEELALLDRGAADVAKLRFIEGLTLEEVAKQLETTFSSARRDWVYARAWLRTRLGNSGPKI